MNRKKNRGPSPESLIAETEKGTYHPFYLLYGEEEYERSRISHWLTEHLAPETARDFNLDIFYGDSFNLDTFLGIYEAYPMMAERRLVVLRDGEKLPPTALKGLENLPKSPVQTSVLIVEAEKVDMRRAFFSGLAKAGRAVQFRPLYDNQVPQWIGQQARRKGLKIDPPAIDLLRLYVGNRLRELDGELEKLAVYTGGDAVIGRETVEVLVGGVHSENIFALTDAVGQGNRPRAGLLLRQLIDAGEEPGRILAMLIRHLQLLLKTQDLLRRKLPNQQMAGQLGVSPFFLQNYLQQARTFPPGKLWGGVGALLWADAKLKSGGRRQGATILELLVHRLLRGAPGRG